MASEEQVERVADAIAGGLTDTSWRCRSLARAAIEAHESGLSGGSQAEANAGAANPESALSGGSVEEARGEAAEKLVAEVERVAEFLAPGEFPRKALLTMAANFRASSSPGACKGTRDEVTVARADLEATVRWLAHGPFCAASKPRGQSCDCEVGRLRASLTEGGE